MCKIVYEVAFISTIYEFLAIQAIIEECSNISKRKNTVLIYPKESIQYRYFEV
jgi:hypothetical protein